MQSAFPLQKQQPGKLAKPLRTQVVSATTGIPIENRLHVFDRNTRVKFLIHSDSVMSLLPKVKRKQFQRQNLMNEQEATFKVVED